MRNRIQHSPPIVNRFKEPRVLFHPRLPELFHRDASLGRSIPYLFASYVGRPELL